MSEPNIEIFSGNREPSIAQLESVCDLFRRNLPVFDDQNVAENADTLSLRDTPDAYRKLLETKTLLLVCGENERISGLLEWDPRDKQEFLLAYITWFLVDQDSRGQGLSTKLHQKFEKQCVPPLIQHTQQTVLQALAVHLKNPALQIYRKWGYSEKGAPQWNDGRRLFMVKSPEILTRGSSS